jgi:hypothetical protein
MSLTRIPEYSPPAGVVTDISLFTDTHLTLTLDGITAGDYLTWVRDPEPPALGSALRCVTVHADPRGDTIEAELRWRGRPPEPEEAARLAGFPLVPEVIAVAPMRLAFAA